MGIKRFKLGNTLKISKKCSEIPMNRYYQTNISKVVFNEGLKTIGKCAFGYTNITNVKLPNSLIKLGYRAFEGCKINSLELGKGLKVIEDGTFMDNKLTELHLPENIEKISNLSFKKNHIEKIEFNENITSIGEQAFSGNSLLSLQMPNSINEIKMYAFENNKLENIVFSENYKIIECGTFKCNNIKNINLTNNIVKIDEDAFACNKLESLTLPESVKEIGAGVFMKNNINELKLNNTITKIPTNAFYNNSIEKLEIPSNVQVIGTNAFFDNNINELKLNEGLKIIGDRAFRNNKFNYVEIPSTVVKIGSLSFDNIDVLCKGQMIEKELVSEFGSELILKIADCKNAVNNINFDLFYPVELELIPVDNDSIKGFINSNKKYRIFEEEVNKSLNGRLEGYDYYKSFFKLNYILGTFRQNPKAIDAITLIYKTLATADIEKMMNGIELVKFDKKLADVIINAALEGHIEELIFIVPHVFNNIPLTKKGILKIKELEIMNLNKKIKQEGKIELQSKLDELKKNKNKIEFKDILSYVKNNMFEISERNKELIEYTPIFNGNIKKYEMSNIETILDKAKLQKENNFNILTDKKNEYTYKWLDNKDPLNLVLGYLVNCCAKYNGSGEDIMIQSMTNPNFKNLVIYKGSEVVAKSTAFYNNDYILCNNIEVSDKYMQNNRLAEKRKLLEMVVKGLKDQANEMNKQGKAVNEIRVGMCRNDLNDVIEFENYNIVKNDLLENYEFHHYQGDANNKAFGQAIIYKK